MSPDTSQPQGEGLVERMARAMHESLNAGSPFVMKQWEKRTYSYRASFREQARTALREVADYAEERVPSPGDPQRVDEMTDAAAIGVESFAQHLREEATR